MLYLLVLYSENSISLWFDIYLKLQRGYIKQYLIEIQTHTLYDVPKCTNMCSAIDLYCIVTLSNGFTFRRAEHILYVGGSKILSKAFCNTYICMYVGGIIIIMLTSHMCLNKAQPHYYYLLIVKYFIILTPTTLSM